jgi:2-amino-4-hydroxy-6-hydroxymethyldihydropteridine diphosphokinase
MPVCLIGLGSNQGDRQATLDAAVAELGRQPQISIAAVSVWRETSPIGGLPGQSPFLNGALRAETSLGPQELLAHLRQIEDHLGRRRTQRWGPRTIDLDLLLYDELVLSTPALTLPHPRMAWRRFVLEPAAEVAGAMLHPTIRWTIARLLEHLNSARPYVAVTGPIGAGKSQLAERLAAAISARLLVEQPDWPLLDAFYANPAGHGWPLELGFVRQRARLLAADEAVWSDPRWTVSDFWFDQSAAFARAWLPNEQRSAFLDQYEQLRRDVVRPKLIVLLDLPAAELLARVHSRGRACEQHLTVEQLERIRQAMQEQATRPDLGPVLHAGGDDPEAVFAEVLAAVRGME